ETNTYRDIDAAYLYLTQTLKIPANKIIAFGRSVGSGPTVDLAARREVAAVILQSPFLSAYRVLTWFPLLPFDKFRNASKVSRIHCPILIMHGESDEVIPFRHGAKLFDLAHEPKNHFWLKGAGHNNFEMVAGKTYIQTLTDFVGQLKSKI